MLLPQTKEREYRFTLALRMVLPIFTLFFALIFHTFISTEYSFKSYFFIELLLLLILSIYFIFYLIYKGFDTKITDDISKIFTREYIYKYLKKEIKKTKEYTLLLISIDNLSEINSRYGLNNGDKVLSEFIIWVGDYFKSKNITKFPIGHLSGSSFIIGLNGNKNDYKTVIELLHLKIENLKINDIEIKISSAINDITFSNNIDYLIENLIELQTKNRDLKLVPNNTENINPSELEKLVANALKKEDLLIFTQDIFYKNEIIFKECFIKLKIYDNKFLHPKDYMKILDKLRLTNNYDYLVLTKIVNICKINKNDTFAVFISPTSIRNVVTFNKIRDLFYNNSYIKDRLILIISESEYFSKINFFNDLLQEIRNLGVKIALDRVGTLHSSFLYFKDLDLDIIRFSTTLIKNIKDVKNSVIVDGYNNIAHNKGLKTWSKLVESKEDKELLENLNIDYFQGKYLSQFEKNEV